MSFILTTDLHVNGCAPGLALKKRLRTTRKWPIQFGQTYLDEDCNDRGGTHLFNRSVIYIGASPLSASNVNNRILKTMH